MHEIPYLICIVLKGINLFQKSSRSVKFDSASVHPRDIRTIIMIQLWIPLLMLNEFPVGVYHTWLLSGF